MSIIFYDHLIKIEEIVFELDNFQLSLEEKDEFINIIDGTFHHQTLLIILDLLPKQFHQNFLDRFYQNPSDRKIIDFLKENINQEVEEIIEKKAQEMKKEILLEIKKSTPKSNRKSKTGQKHKSRL